MKWEIEGEELESCDINITEQTEVPILRLGRLL